MSSFVPATRFELVGSPAIVTGGAQGIGFEIGRQLLDHGADLVVFDVDAEATMEAVSACAERFPERTVLPFVGDVTSEADWAAVFDLAERELATPRILVNNAPDNEMEKILGTSVERWDRINAVNATGAFLGIREIGRRFVRHRLRPWGAVVNVTTLNYLIATQGQAAYCASKASLTQLTKVAALEFAEIGIRVNAVAPGLTRTPLSERFFGEAPEVPQAYIDRTPLGRVAQPVDQARAALFLCTDASEWLTGEILHNDGGAHLVGVPNNWEVMKGPLGLEEPDPEEWGPGTESEAG